MYARPTVWEHPPGLPARREGVGFVSRWIVSNVPAWLELLGLIVLIAGGAVLIQSYVRHRFPRLTEGDQSRVTESAFRFIGVVYAFFIGFLVNAMWGQINAADTSVRTEGTAGVQLARDLTVFDKADSDRIRQSLLEYERAAYGEWPTAARGHFLPAADDALHRLYTAYEEVQPRTDTQKTLLARSFTNLDTVSRSRTDRVILARVDVGPPWPLWAAVLLISGLVLGAAIIFGVEQPATTYRVVATVGVAVAAQLFLVLELTQPLIGAVAASPEPLQVVIHFLSPSSA